MQNHKTKMFSGLVSCIRYAMVLSFLKSSPCHTMKNVTLYAHLNLYKMGYMSCVWSEHDTVIVWSQPDIGVCVPGILYLCNISYKDNLGFDARNPVSDFWQ